MKSLVVFLVGVTISQAAMAREVKVDHPCKGLFYISLAASIKASGPEEEELTCYGIPSPGEWVKYDTIEDKHFKLNKRDIGDYWDFSKKARAIQIRNAAGRIAFTFSVKDDSYSCVIVDPGFHNNFAECPLEEIR